MNIHKPEELIKKNLIVKMQAGSHAYGTNIETSDEDFRGIFCAEPVQIRTPFFRINEASDTSEEDTKFYEVSKFLQLYTDCNPNIVELLWTDNSDIVSWTPAYMHLRKYREDLLSSKAAFTFSGYALAQLKRIKGHNKWISNPQVETPPHQVDYVSLVQWFGKEKQIKLNLRDIQFNRNHRLIPYGGDIFGLMPATGYSPYNFDTGALNTTFEEDHHLLGVPIAILKFNREVYKTDLEKWNQYWEWKRNRNKTRSELEEKYTYDTKHAMHLVRLLRMGVEILRDQKVIVKRPDAQELLSIRYGAWTYDQLVKYAEDMDKEVREVWYKKTPLPKKPNIHLAATVLMAIQDMVWDKSHTVMTSAERVYENNGQSEISQ